MRESAKNIYQTAQWLHYKKSMAILMGKTEDQIEDEIRAIAAALIMDVARKNKEKHPDETEDIESALQIILAELRVNVSVLE